jgi:hypothetical protein
MTARETLEAEAQRYERLRDEAQSQVVSAMPPAYYDTKARALREQVRESDIETSPLFKM